MLTMNVVYCLWNVLVLFVTFSDALDLFGSECPGPDWLIHEDRCYLVIPRFATWSKSKAFCENEQNAEMVSIGGLDESVFINRETASLCNKISCLGRVWLGLSPTSEGSWAWLDRTPYGWNRWKTSPPLYPPSGSDCVAMDLSDASWSIAQCHATYLNVCETKSKSFTKWYIIIGAGGGGFLLLLVICCCCCCCCRRKGRCQDDNLSDVWSMDEDDIGYASTRKPRQRSKRSSRSSASYELAGLSTESRKPAPLSPHKNNNFRMVLPARDTKLSLSCSEEMTPLGETETESLNAGVVCEPLAPVVQRVHSIENRL